MVDQEEGRVRTPLRHYPGRTHRAGPKHYKEALRNMRHSDDVSTNIF